MGYRRWFRSSNVQDCLSDTLIVCVYCRLESIAADRGLPLQGYGSVAAYVKHYANQHMWIHGMLSVSDVRRQTVMWESERIQRSRKPFVYDLPAGFRTYRPEVFNLNLD